MIEKYLIGKSIDDNDFSAIDMESETPIAYGSKDEMITFCAKLNRLAALEKVCKEIVESAPDDLGVLHREELDMYSSNIGHQRQTYLIAQKLKAVMEESK